MMVLLGHQEEIYELQVEIIIVDSSGELKQQRFIFGGYIHLVTLNTRRI